MLQIFLSILKIIGIFILFILAFALVLLLCLLFVPVRYKGKAKKNHEIVAKINFTWLFHMISVHVLYNKEVNIILKIFGVPIYNYHKKQKKDNIKKDNIKKEKKVSRFNNQRKLKKDIKKDDINDAKNDEMKNLADSKVSVIKEEIIEEETLIEDETLIEEETLIEQFQGMNKKNKILILLRKIYLLIKGFFVKIMNIKFTIKKICDKMKNVKEVIYYYVDLMEQEESKEAISLCKDQLLFFLNHIKPRRLKAHITFGTGDPSTTGQILGYASMFYPIYGNNVSLNPDFTNEILEGDIYLKGRVRVFMILRIGFKVMFNKNLKQFIKLLKREAI